MLYTFKTYVQFGSHLGMDYIIIIAQYVYLLYYINDSITGQIYLFHPRLTLSIWSLDPKILFWSMTTDYLEQLL